jgi:hypothetical protein
MFANRLTILIFGFAELCTTAFVFVFFAIGTGVTSCTLVTTTTEFKAAGVIDAALGAGAEVTVINVVLTLGFAVVFALPFPLPLGVDLGACGADDSSGVRLGAVALTPARVWFKLLVVPLFVRVVFVLEVEPVPLAVDLGCVPD